MKNTESNAKLSAAIKIEDLENAGLEVRALEDFYKDFLREIIAVYDKYGLSIGYSSLDETLIIDSKSENMVHNSMLLNLATRHIIENSINDVPGKPGETNVVTINNKLEQK